jgi:hypothetical protein
VQLSDPDIVNRFPQLEGRSRVETCSTFYGLFIRYNPEVIRQHTVRFAHLHCWDRDGFDLPYSQLGEFARCSLRESVAHYEDDETRYFELRNIRAQEAFAVARELLAGRYPRDPNAPPAWRNPVEHLGISGISKVASQHYLVQVGGECGGCGGEMLFASTNAEHAEGLTLVDSSVVCI